MFPLLQNATAPTQAISQATPSSRHRFHLLDGLRGVAAILVVFTHAPLTLRPHALHSAFRAVDFFFCLSGFVIAFSYERRLQGSFRFRQFVVARLIRLYPIYLMGILLGLAFVLAISPNDRNLHWFTNLALVLGCQLLLLPDLITKGTHPLFPLDFPAWSIFFELLANFGYALLVRKRLGSTPHIVGVFIASVLAASLWIHRGHNIVALPNFNLTGVSSLIRVAIPFLAGVLLFRIFHAQKSEPWSGATSMLAALAITSALLLLLVAPTVILQSQVFNLLTAAILFPGLVYLGARCRIPEACVPACTALGDLSYPLYLIHAPLLYFLDRPWVLRSVQQHPALAMLPIPTFAVIASCIAYLIFHYFDVPLRSFLIKQYNAAIAA